MFQYIPYNVILQLCLIVSEYHVKNKLCVSKPHIKWGIGSQHIVFHYSKCHVRHQVCVIIPNVMSDVSFILIFRLLCHTSLLCQYSHYRVYISRVSFRIPCQTSVVCRYTEYLIRHQLCVIIPYIMSDINCVSLLHWCNFLNIIL